MTTPITFQTFTPVKWHAGACLGVCAALLSTAAGSETGIFRCPGRPVVYTTDARTAASQNCRPAGAEITQSPPKASAGEQETTTRSVERARAVRADEIPVSTAKVASAKPPPKLFQTGRDSDRLAILQSELSREKDRLAQLKTKAGETRIAAPDPTAKLAQPSETELAIRRSESDIASLTRELSRAMR